MMGALTWLLGAYPSLWCNEDAVFEIHARFFGAGFLENYVAKCSPRKMMKIGGKMNLF